jgi:membrane-bound lytic murein transglycosylase A
MMRKYFLITIALLIVAAASFFLLKLLKKPAEWRPENALKPVSAPDITDRSDADSLMSAVDNSLRYYERLFSNKTGAELEAAQQKTVSFGPDNLSLSRIVESLRDFKTRLTEFGLSDRFFQYVQQNYRFYRSGSDSVLFTGYYEADLKGSLTPTPTYRFPLYRKPADLYRVDLSKFYFYESNKWKNLPRILRGRIEGDGRIAPYFSRREIDYRNKLAGRGLEIAWVNNPIDAFFLHIQGSGIIQLENGEILRVNYAESNGHPYRAIGRWLIKRDLVSRENMSMQSIRQYLEAHPEQMEEIFCYNPSYIFFREVQEGPIGFLGVPVTPYRSIALDRRLFPRGALCYIETDKPVFDTDGKLQKWESFKGFVLNQDTGGAIRTPGRVDLFTGHGKESRLTAGLMKQPGTFFFLVKKVRND